MTDETKCFKKCFETKADAKKYLKEKNKTIHMGFTNVYFCDQCKSYHLTTMKKEQSRNLGRFLKKKKKNK